jgi:hypothetical protein
MRWVRAGEYRGHRRDARGLVPAAAVGLLFALFVALSGAPVHGEQKDSGAPGSDERRDWCLELLRECQRNVEGECAGRPDPAKCRADGYGYCDANFAPSPGSDCLNKARLLRIPRFVPPRGVLQLSPGR